MKKTENKINKKIFQQSKYITLSIIIATIFYLLNVIIINFKNIISIFNSLGFVEVLKSFYTFSKLLYQSIEIQGFISLIIISMLTGILLSLLIYRYKHINKESNVKITTSIGLFLGIILPGCASCGIGLAAILGLSSSLLFLPLKGLEISILAIIIISYSIIKTSKAISKVEKCEI